MIFQDHPGNRRVGLHVRIQQSIFAKMVHNPSMRTTITLDDDAYDFASIYARAKGITLGVAISELIRNAESAPQPAPDIRQSANGLACFPPTGIVLTSQMVKEAECEFE
jgi:hypothetical protein